MSLSTKAQQSYYWWFESQTKLEALILQALVTQNPDDKLVDNILFTLMKQQARGYWQNTVTTASVLEAISTYIKQRNLDQTNYTGTASINGKKVLSEKFEDANAKPKTIKLPFEDEFISTLEKDKEIPLVFEKDGKGHLFYTFEMKYALPDEMQVACDAGIKIKYDIVDAKTGAVVNANLKDNQVIKFEDGKLYKATVQIESNHDHDYLALRAPIPSGAEILDSTFVTTGSEGAIESTGDWRHSISNKYIKDNEIQFFWDEFRSGSTSITFTFRTTRRGVYPVPPVQAECMYESEIYGRSDGYLGIIE